MFVRVRLYKWHPLFDRFLDHNDTQNDGKHISVRTAPKRSRRADCGRNEWSESHREDYNEQQEAPDVQQNVPP